jgi:DNA polymerase I-like protein with 3'-5' exonuclease and polymerase domains
MMPTDEIIFDWVPPENIPEIPDGCVVALDLETHDPKLKELGPGWAFGEGHIVGVALAWGDDSLLGCGYWPLRHLAGNWQGDVGKFMRWLRFQLRRPTLEWTFANATYDLGWLNVVPEGKIHDVQVAAPLLDEHRYSYSLDALAKTELGEGKDEDLLKQWAKQAGIKGNAKGMMALLPSAVVGPYAEQDARATWRLHQVYKKRIEEQNLTRVYDLETGLIPMLMDMRRTGVRVDVDRAQELRELVLTEENEAKRALRHSTGMRIDAWDIQLQIRALKAEGFTKFPKTAKKQQEGLTAPVLEALAREDSKAGLVAGQILELRRKNRQRVTFIERLVLEHHYNGRIHAQFNALRNDDGGTVSGRFSSQDPNLQQLPARDEEASQRIRGLFLGEEDELVASVDYSSQEPRLAIHWAVQGGSRSAKKMAEEFHRNPRLDLHQKVADLMDIDRKKAKILNLAQMYGQGGGSLCLALGLEANPDSFVNDQGKEIQYLAPGRQGQAIIEEYNKIVPFMKMTAKGTEREAREKGFITTLFGRRCRVFYYKDSDGNPTGDDARKMFNRRIQGSAADMIKQAMLDAWRSGYRLRMTVHDENVFSVESVKEAKECVEIMNNAVELEVPVVCDLAVGKTWGTCEEVTA